MAYLYVPGLPGSTSESSLPWNETSPPACTWRGKSLLPQSWPRVWRRVESHAGLSGTMSRPSMAALYADRWTLLLVAFRASRSAQPVSVSASTTSDGWERNSSESYLTWHPPSSSWRTSRGSLLMEQDESPADFPRSGSMRSGICSPQPQSERPTSGSGSSWSRGDHRWPTPAATDYKGSSQIGQRRGQLSEAILRATWPTPTAGDSKSSGSRNAPGSKANAGVSLTDMIRTGDSHGRRDRATPKGGETGSTEEAPRRQLNPAFVETLMGFPVGWTDCEL